MDASRLHSSQQRSLTARMALTHGMQLTDSRSAQVSARIVDVERISLNRLSAAH
jgi:hypothetical protein